MKIYKNRIGQVAVAVAMLGLTGCFTGVENTPTITDKDVSRAINELEQRQPTSTLKAYTDSVAAWQVGKQFYVTDNQFRLILDAAQSVQFDTTSLAGTILTYAGHETVVGLDNREVIDLRLSSGDNTYIYHTGRTMGELSSSWSIPLLVDMDMVASMARQLEGKDVYIKTPIWYDMKGEYMIRGRQFIKVHIDRVLPGSKVMPLKLVFTASDNGEQAFVWMAPAGSAINNRDYDSMFTSKDVHENYRDITPERWNLIVHGDVEAGMTKEECRLSRGVPRNITRQPRQTEVTEYWHYDGGSYLQFVDGLLRNYRK